MFSFFLGQTTMMTFISCRRLMSNFGVLFDAKTGWGRHDGGIYFVMFD